MQGDVAVLLPVFNAREELRETLRSLASQDLPFTCFVIDDGSEPAVQIEGDHGFPVELIRVLPNKGITAALNIGLDAILARGFRYIARIDAGDLAMPGRFAAQVKFLDEHPDHALVSTAFEAFDDKGKTVFEVTPPLHDREIRRALFYKNPMLHPGIMFNAAFFADGLRYDERFRAGQDYEIILRLSKLGKIANLPEKFNRYQLSPNSITFTRKRRYFGRMRIQLLHFDPLSLHSYLGILRSLALCFVPFGFFHWLRSLKNNLA